MDTVAFQKVTTTAADITKSVVEGQVQLFDIYAKHAEGTPISSFFNAAASMQRATLQGIDSLSATLNAAPANSAGKTSKAKNSTASTLKAATKAVKNVVNAQADALIEADASTLVATSKAKEAVAKVASSAAKGDLACAYTDLTVVAGIGPSTMKKLHAEGIRSVSDLAKTSNKDLTAIIEKAKVRMLKYSPADWIADAKQLLKAA